MNTTGRRKWIVWTVLILLALVPAARLVVGLVNARSVVGPVETVIYVFVIPVVVIVAIFAAITASIGRGLPRLRALHPAAVAAAIMLRPDNVDDFRALTGVRLREGRSHSLDATFERSEVRFWRGRRPRLVGQIAVESLTFAVGEITTSAGAFPALLMTVRSRNEVRTFRFVPANERARWFPKQLNRAQTEDLVAQLNERAGVPPVH
jgi:hypothetical protein